MAVVGASSNREKYGNKAVRAFRAEGWTVVPINPREHEIEGLTAYPSVLDIPHAIDMVTVYVPPSETLRLLAEFDARQIPEVWLNPGSEDDAVLAEAQRRGLNIIAACSIVGVGRMPSEF